MEQRTYVNAPLCQKTLKMGYWYSDPFYFTPSRLRDSKRDQEGAWMCSLARGSVTRDIGAMGTDWEWEWFPISVTVLYPVTTEPNCTSTQMAVINTGFGPHGLKPCTKSSAPHEFHPELCVFLQGITWQSNLSYNSSLELVSYCNVHLVCAYIRTNPHYSFFDLSG